MLLNHAGLKTNKLSLTNQIKKDPTPYKKKNGKIYFGHPNTGFVGDMYSFKTHSFGVLNKPIEDLAKKHLPVRIINLTEKSFTTIEEYVAAGHPVWIINTSWFGSAVY